MRSLTSTPAGGLCEDHKQSNRFRESSKSKIEQTSENGGLKLNGLHRDHPQTSIISNPTSVRFKNASLNLYLLYLSLKVFSSDYQGDDITSVEGPSESPLGRGLVT